MVSKTNDQLDSVRICPTSNNSDTITFNVQSEAPTKEYESVYLNVGKDETLMYRTAGSSNPKSLVEVVFDYDVPEDHTFVLNFVILNADKHFLDRSVTYSYVAGEVSCPVIDSNGNRRTKKGYNKFFRSANWSPSNPDPKSNNLAALGIHISNIQGATDLLNASVLFDIGPCSGGKPIQADPGISIKRKDP